ncbi:hypothetical protein BC832DRAFT_557373 [Gaertneriomyces semiglobifer]|nr:hypothetical protein BC832DRAFT_557373 [Gaertneriomyces semiglobifer]
MGTNAEWGKVGSHLAISTWGWIELLFFAVRASPPVPISIMLVLSLAWIWITHRS